MDGGNRELLEAIDRRLASIEEKVERIIALPRALKPKDAAALLGCSLAVLKRDIRRKRVRTVLIGDRQHVPMSELVRLTTVTVQPHSSPMIPPRRRNEAEALSEAEKIRALARKR